MERETLEKGKEELSTRRSTGREEQEFPILSMEQRKTKRIARNQELPGEIMFDILSRLPPKSLIRFKSVRKTWRFLFAEPSFVRTNLNHTNKHHHKLLVRSSACGFHSIDYEAPNCNATVRNFPVDAPYGVKVIGSCNGLICVHIIMKNHVYGTGYGTLVLWNPATSDYKKLPDPNNFHSGSPVPQICTFGFGYNCSVDDYEVVRLNFTYQVDIYSLKTNSWKEIRYDALNYNNVAFDHLRMGIHVNGCIYWRARNSQDVHDLSTILGFDLKEEKFIEVRYPFDVPGRHSVVMKVMGGHLAVYQDSDNAKIELWTMMESIEEPWIKLMTLPSLYVAWKQFMEPLFFLKTGEVLMSIMHPFGRQKKFAIYNPEKKWVVQIFSVCEIGGWFDEMTYLESLISPNIVAV